MEKTNRFRALTVCSLARDDQQRPAATPIVHPFPTPLWPLWLFRFLHRWRRVTPLRRSWLQVDCGNNGLGQPIEHVRPECSGALKKVAKYEHVEADLLGNLLQRPPAMMNRSTQMARKRILRRCLVEQLTALEQFRQFSGDLVPIPL